MEIRCQIIFNFASEQFLNWKVSALDNGFYKQNLRDVGVLESVQSCFELSIHFSVFAAGSREILYRQMYEKLKTRLDAF